MSEIYVKVHWQSDNMDNEARMFEGPKLETLVIKDTPYWVIYDEISADVQTISLWNDNYRIEIMPSP